MIKNISVFTMDKSLAGFERVGQEKDKTERSSVFGGNLKQNSLIDPVEERKREARQQAFQVVENAWKADREIDEDLKERRLKIADLMKECEEATKGIRELSEMQERVKAEYGISEDSQEHHDLQLLLREQKMFKDPGSQNAMSADSLTAEEMKYVAKLKAEGLTDYQTKQLELEEAKDYYENTIKENKKRIREETAVIRGIRQERLKHEPMVKASKEAEEILEESARQIIDLLTEKAQEHRKEVSEEKKEEAEKLEEKQEELERLLKERKQEDEELEELLEKALPLETPETGRLEEELRQELDRIVSRLKLVEEDIKGAVVDENR